MAHCVVCDGAFLGELKECSSCKNLFHVRYCGEASAEPPLTSDQSKCAICAGRYSSDSRQRLRQLSASKPAIVQIRRPHFAREARDLDANLRVTELNAKMAKLNERIAHLNRTLAEEQGRLESWHAHRSKEITHVQTSLGEKRELWKKIAAKLSVEKDRLKEIEKYLYDPRHQNNHLPNLRKYNSTATIVDTYLDALERIEGEGRALSSRQKELGALPPQQDEVNKIMEQIEQLMLERASLASLLREALRRPTDID